MIALWVARAVIVGAVFGVAAEAAAAAFGEAQRPRRWIWVVAIVLSMVVPFVGPMVPVPGLGVPTTVLMAGEHPVVETLAADRANPAFLIAWIVASLVLLGGFVWSHRRVRRAATGSARVISGVPVIVSERVGPAVLGIAAPEIIVPRWALGTAPEEQALMLRHEVEHLAARDTLLLALSAVALVCMPWNVALWWQSRRLRRAVETDCDARVLATGCDIRTYGAMLLAMTGRATCLSPMIPMLGGTRTLLEERIRAMTANVSSRRSRLIPLGTLALVFTVVAVALALPSGARFMGQAEVVVAGPGAHPSPSYQRASLVMLDGRPSSYEELRVVVRQARLGRMTRIPPDEAVRRFGPVARSGAMIATSK